jgi:hypothetical protein
MKKCKLCQKEIPSTIIIKGKKRNLKNRKYCFSCSPFGSRNTMKLENGAKLTKEEKKKRKSISTYKWQKKTRKKRKEILVQIFGGECSMCGYNNCNQALEFHHIDPEAKEADIGTMGIISKWETIVDELKKCVLVCSNCHAEIHCGRISQQNVEVYYTNNKEIISKKLDEEISKCNNKKNIKKSSNKICLNCGNHFYNKNKNVKYCSFQCSVEIRNKNSKNPPKEQLIKDLKEYKNWCAIGRKYGVTDNSVRKWAKKYNII